MVVGCIGVVVALGVFAASPNLHEQLHHNGQLSLDDGCAVVLFAGGVSVPLAPITVLPAPSTGRGLAWVEAEELLLEAPRFLLPPGRGPPVA